MTCPSELLDGALALARTGIPVIPLRPRSKVPVHARWPDLGLLEENAIRQEWELNRDSNVGALCGPEALDGDGLTIVDVDLPDGPGTLQALEREYGSMPATTKVDTPSGGMHYYLRGCTPSWNPGPGLEVRSAGRQCAAPPSIHPNGGEYTWQHNLDHDLPALPAWLAKADTPPRPRTAFTPTGLIDPVLEVPPPVYFRKLCGLVPDRDGFVCCPLHGEQEASLKVYPTADRGWFCYGESCRRGGDVVTLVAELAGAETPVRGYRFVALLEYLRGRLL
jgi:hypothetical protein